MKTGFYLGVTALAVGLLAGGFLMGDDKKPDEPAKLKGKLPAHFTKLGLSDKQKQEIFKIEASYTDKIEALQQQLFDLKKAERQEEITVLTEEQKTHLKELQTGDAGSKDKPVIVDKDKTEVKPAVKDKTTEIKDKPVIVDKDKGPPAKDKEKDK